MTALSRAAGATGTPAPVRQVHLGLGIFHRAHQAWYAQQAARLAPDDPWGIAAFTGRRPDAAERLAAQDGLYHVLVRRTDPSTSTVDTRAELVTSIVEAVDGRDLATWCRHLADPAVGVLTTTITEAGYRRGPDGGIDRADPDVAYDIELPRSPHCDQAARTAPGRIVQGLAARWQADAGPIAVVSCDNLADNATACRRVVTDLAGAALGETAPEFLAWLESNVSFVSTVVDRITVRTTDEHRALVRELTGFSDVAPVATEAYVEWILAGDFPAGRPPWDLAGARFVNDTRPFEQRKLWLLNGAHSLLAYAGAARGHATVADAMADPTCRAWVEAWWDEACRHLPLPASELADYRAALVERFCEPAIRHTLAQIQADGSQKVPIRLLPVVARERANGDMPDGGVIALAGWLTYLRSGGAGARVRSGGAGGAGGAGAGVRSGGAGSAGGIDDPRAAELAEIVEGSLETATRRLLALVEPAVDPAHGLCDDAQLVRSIARAARELSGSRRP